MRIILYAITFLFLLQSTASGQPNTGTITGSLSDSASKQPLGLATVSVYKIKDSTLATYRMSSPEGNFKISGLPVATGLKLVITFSGYRVYKKELYLTIQKPTESLGNIALSPDTRSLDEVLIYSEKPPVIVKNDTIEFNAASFKTLPAALVEDLLKKLPGVDIDKSGNIVINGKPVNRIMVDGKDFFGGDPKIATRNLPANIIDKVQVMDDKRQLEANPTMNKDEADQVINLKLKKSIKKGWFGKAYAGVGTIDRNEAGAIINSFRDTLQISTLVYTNNLNRSGFSSDELFNLGGFQRSGVSEMSTTSSGGIAFNGISFGGMGEGILRSSGGGLNINYSAKKNFNTNLMYFTGSSHSDNTIKENTLQTIADTSFTTVENKINRSKTVNNRIGGTIEWAIDSLSSFYFRPVLTFGNSDGYNRQTSHFSSSSKGNLYNTANNQTTNDNSIKYLHEFSISRRFTNKFPSARIDNITSISNSDNSRLTNAITDFFTSSLSHLDQLQNRDNNKFYSSTNFNLTKYFNKTLQINLSHNITFIKNTDALNVYELDGLSGKYDVYNPLLSNRVTQSGTKNNTSVFVHQRGKKITMRGSLGLLSLDMDNKFDKYPQVKQHYRYLLPTAGLSIMKTNISYSASVTEPVATNLQPVIDNSNPVFQVLGNPELRPTLSHNISLYKNKYDGNKLLSVYIYLNGSFQKDAVIRERWLSTDGIQYTKPFNQSGVWNLSQQVSVNKQYKLSVNRLLSWNLGANAGYTRTFTRVNKITSKMHTKYFVPSIRIGMNWNDRMEVSQSVNYSWNRNTYSIKDFPAATIRSFYYSSDIVIRLPRKMVWESNLEYGRNSDVTPGFNQSSLRLNIAVNYQFLKEDKANLRLSVFDVLKQNAGISRYVKENFIRDTEQTVLTRYFLLSFSYNIRNFRTKKTGGRDTFFMF